MSEQPQELETFVVKIDGEDVLFVKLDAHNAALAASQTAADEFFRANGILTQQLLAAQAAIADVTTELEALQYHIKNKQWNFADATIKSAISRTNVDLSALDKHNAEVPQRSEPDYDEIMRRNFDRQE